MDKQRNFDLPQVPSLWKMIGPSFVLLGLALGSGELILWPYLAAQHGLGLLWGALLGISLQYILNTEAMRYTLYWGESVFVGFRRMSLGLTIWYIISTFVPWSIPGFSSATTDILVTVFPSLPKPVVAVGLLLLTGLLLSSGTSLYKTIERFQKIIIFLGMPFLFLLAFIFAEPIHWNDMVRGLVGSGAGYWFFPTGIAIGSFVGAFAYSGAGGNLNLAQSYYIKEKGFGMGAYMGKISSLFSHKAKPFVLEGQTFAHTKHNRDRWKAWWYLVSIEHAVVFWLLGLVSICVLAVLSYATVYGQDVQSGINFLYAQSAAISARTSSVVGTLFLLVSAITLFSTQVGVMESSARIISENVVLLSGTKRQKVNIGAYFYGVLWMQLSIGAVIYLLGIREPRVLLTTAAICNAAAMMLSFPILFLLNHKRLAKPFRAGALRYGAMGIAVAVFAVLLFEVVRDF
jgi:hypothetical protein